jgi:hypothetical protein
MLSTAHNTVISTPELLELILSHLPMRDLLMTAPLVNKTWQSITLTPSVQRALFFEPDPSSEHTQNPLLVEVFSIFFKKPQGQNRWYWPDYEAINSLPWSKTPEAFKRPEASWRRMLVAQPPVRTMRITERCHGQACDSERHADVDDLSLRMGYLYDLTLPLVDRIASSFCVRWNHYAEDSDREADSEPEDEDGSGSDLTLAVVYTSQCSPYTRPLVDGKLYSDAHKDIKIEFGASEVVPRA